MDKTTDPLLRLGLIGAGMFLIRLGFSAHLFSAYFTDAPLIQSPVFVVTLVLFSGLSLFVVVLGAVGRVGAWARWLILIICLTDLVIRAAILGAGTVRPNALTDSESMRVEFAGALLLRGENPYTWDTSGVSAIYDAPAGSDIGLHTGGTASGLPYPALSILAVIPFQLLGLPGMLALSFTVFFAIIAGLFIAAPQRWQPVILLPLIAADAQLYSVMTLRGSVDLLWVAALVGAVLLWESRWRPVWVGAALALHPLPWLMLPFLALRAWHTATGNRRAAVIRLLGGALAIFGLINLPFIIWNPGAWTANMLAMFAPTQLVSGFGLAALSENGLLNLPPSYYSFLIVGLLGLVWVLYVRHPQTFDRLIWLLPSAFAWMGPAPSASSWLFGLIPAIAALIAPPVCLPEPAPASRTRRSTVTTAAALALALVATFGLQAANPQTLMLTPVFPIGVNTLGELSEITVEVDNRGSSVVDPRFAVQPVGAEHPIPWKITEGPQTLEAGESARYTIASPSPQDGFFTLGQVVLTDAASNQSQHLAVGPYDEYGFPDAIFNPAFELWSLDTESPLGWQTVMQPASVGSLDFETIDGRGALALNLNPLGTGLNRIALETQIISPTAPFDFWVYADLPEDLATERLLYGLDIQTGDRRILLLYGDTDAAAAISPTLYMKRFALTPGEWVRQTVDLPAIYAEAGWPAPEPTYTVFRQMEADLSLTTLRLTFAVTGAAEPVTAYFGGLEQASVYQDPTELMDVIFDDPAAYYARLAAQHERMRNYNRAVEAYDTALRYTPDDPDLLTRREQAQLAADALREAQS